MAENKHRVRTTLIVTGVGLAGVGLGVMADRAGLIPGYQPKNISTGTATPTPDSERGNGSTLSEQHSFVEKQVTVNDWMNFWPNTPEDAAKMFGGTADQWQRNPEWPDTRTIDNPALNVKGFQNREWRPTNAENLPFNWPKTAKEALEYFWPGQNIQLKYIQPAWKDPKTGVVTGWHLSEDHWLDGGNADARIIVHEGEVAEGYTVNGTLDPKDDRNWAVWGGPKSNNPGNGMQAIMINMQRGQGWTVWMPGTDPNTIGLRMELFQAGDTPFFQGPEGQQLGPVAINFTPVYPSPQSK